MSHSTNMQQPQQSPKQAKKDWLLKKAKRAAMYARIKRFIGPIIEVVVNLLLILTDFEVEILEAIKCGWRYLF